MTEVLEPLDHPPSFAYTPPQRRAIGHGLGASDQHITEAVARWRKRDLAISIRPEDEDHIRAEKARYHQKFPAADIAFFDATTHPLGSPEVNLSTDPA